MKLSSVPLLLTLWPFLLLAQNADSANFFPAHAGDVWQYRSQSSGGLAYTRYTDSVAVDPTTKDAVLYDRKSNGTTYGSYRVDSTGNVYNLSYQSNYVRYKLYADSGDAWICGYVNDSIPVTVTIARIYQAVLFGLPTRVKVYRFDIQNPPPVGTFWIGNDYLASGFGLIRSEIEPSEVQYLSGARINEVLYGTVVSVAEKVVRPKSLEIITNYPNPFNNGTVFQYSLSSRSHVNIAIHDVLGRMLREIVNADKSEGIHQVFFSADNLTSGVYFATMKTNSTITTHRLLLMK
ncbi:MAG: T9SS type A sorting domain-containing protein [Bacteroidota bacterium]